MLVVAMSPGFRDEVASGQGQALWHIGTAVSVR